ncbi:MAG: hypothetical protein A2289_16170 [Deltaproteobacteria bacterium RIFOXYA12_FULL_58_15]|nr:MAG: hypothetical protein A2289_16170 [Deltaproteobacteria bacterium RIFOXYA12_FULL_58_15]OGR15232.1 MAG: hypothetical protein A2341_09060 [Deltaproteobacteria bacterium RIFOXYB12_FULL_58_9]
MNTAMPRKPKLKLPPINLGKESVGERIARLRGAKGYTQAELAEKIGIIQVLVSDYELGKLRIHAEMLARFAKTLGVSADELIGLKKMKANGQGLSRKVVRRMQQIEALSERHQRALLQTIDTYLKGAQA